MISKFQITAELQEDFCKATRTADYAPFLEKFKSMIENADFKLKYSSLKCKDPLCRHIETNFKELCNVLRKFDVNNPRKSFGLYHTERYHSEFLADIRTSIKNCNWSNFYAKYKDRADCIIHRARSDNIINFEIEADGSFYSDFTSRDEELKPTIRGDPFHSRNSGEGMANVGHPFPSKPSAVASRYVGFQKQLPAISKEYTIKSDATNSLYHADQRRQTTPLKYCGNGVNGGSSQYILEGEIKISPPVKLACDNKSLVAEDNSTWRNADLLRQYNNHSNPPLPKTVINDKLEGKRMKTHHPTSASTSWKYQLAGEPEGHKKVEKFSENHALSYPATFKRESNSRTTHTEGKTNLEQMYEESRTRVKCPETQSSAATTWNSRPNADKKVVQNKTQIPQSSENPQLSSCYLGNESISGNNDSFEVLELKPEIISKEENDFHNPFIETCDNEDMRQSLRNEYQEQSNRIDKMLNYPEPLFSPDATEDDSFEKKRTEQEEAFRREREEFSRKRREQQEKFEETFRKAKEASKARIKALIACILYKQRFEEQEQMWREWIGECRNPIIKLKRNFDELSDTVEHIYKKLSVADLLKDFEQERASILSQVMLTFNLLENDFEKLKELESRCPQAQFVRILQKCVADVATLLLDIKLPLEKNNMTYSDFTWIRKKFFILSPEMIHATWKLREESSNGVTIGQEIKFPRIHSSLLIEEEPLLKS